jgi:hypothetical protein
MSPAARTLWVNGSLCVLALAAALLAFQVSRAPAVRAPTGIEQRLLPGLTADAVEELLLSDGKRSLRIHRARDVDSPWLRVFGITATEWVITEPVLQLADLGALRGLLASLERVVWERPLSAPSKAAAAGPTLDITVSGHRWQLELGAELELPPGARTVWLSAPAEAPRAYALSAAAVRDIFKNLDNWVEPHWLPLGSSSIANLREESPRGSWQIERSAADARTNPGTDGKASAAAATLAEHGPWRFVEPYSTERVSRARVQELLLTLAEASLDPVLPLAEAESGLAAHEHSRLTVLLATTKTSPSFAPGASPSVDRIELEWGAACLGPDGSPSERVMALRRFPPLAGCIDARLLRALERATSDLRDQQLFYLRAEEVGAARVSRGPSAIELERDGEAFVSRPQGDPVAMEAARPRLERLLGLRGTRVPKPNPEPPLEGEITLGTAGAAQAAGFTERVGLFAGSRAFRHFDGAWFELPDEAGETLGADATWLRALQIFDYPVDGLSALELETPAGPRQQIERDTRGHFIVTAPHAVGWDEREGPALLERLLRLRASRWVSDRLAPPGFGLEQPALAAVLKLKLSAEGPQPHAEVERRLRVGARAAGGFYASVDRVPGVFILAAEDYHALRQGFVDRTLLPWTDSSYSDLRLVRARATAHCERAAQGWAAAPGSVVSPELLGWLNARADLRAETVVHWGPPRGHEGLGQPSLRLELTRHGEVPVKPAAQSALGEKKEQLVLAVGACDVLEGQSICYARRSDRDAVYALARGWVQALLDRW